MAGIDDIEPLLREYALPRQGLRPVPVHVNVALSAMLGKSPPEAEIFDGMRRMVNGIKTYMAHPYRRSIPPLETVWREGEVSLYYAGATQEKSGETLLLLPSLINRSHILDLMPDKSFARWMAQRGVNVYLLDWGAPAGDPAMETLDDLVNSRLISAMNFVAQTHGDFHALGYCMGGTLLAAAAASETGALPDLKSFIFLAAPWDFHAGDRVLADKINAGAPSALQMIESSGRLPAEWIQSVFAMVSGDRTVKKFSDFAVLPPDTDQAKLFVAVEDWLNDGVDLPGKIAATCIVDWYGKNRLCANDREIRMPALLLAAANDRLVPTQSALALAGLLRGARILEPDIGHVGMMVGRRAEEKVWRPVLQWLQGGYREARR